MTMITPSYLGETIEYSSLHACRSTLEDPTCHANLKLKSIVLPGKRIRCPKCATVFLPPSNGKDALSRKVSEAGPRKAAPRFENEDEEQDEERVSAQPRKRARAAPRLEDEDDTPEERPVRRKKKKTASLLPLVLLLVGGGVLFLGAGVTLAVVFWPSQGKPDPVAGTNPPVMKPGSPDGGKGPAGGDPSPSHPGRAIFDRNGCARCHAVSASGGPAKGPNLSRVGAAPDHTVEWLSDHIRDPKSHKPQSRMPGYAGKIQDQDLRSLAEYLASLK